MRDVDRREILDTIDGAITVLEKLRNTLRGGVSPSSYVTEYVLDTVWCSRGEALAALDMLDDGAEDSA